MKTKLVLSRRLLLLSATLLATLLSGCTILPGTSVAKTASGWNQYGEAGAGSPVVIFEAGAGEGMSSWAKVYPEVARFTHAFAYSRDGHGLSAPVLYKRTGQNAVRDLRALLTTRGIKPPYVLVGHSLGGVYMELFAKLYPAEVAGLVLVDTPHPDYSARMKEQFPGKYRIVQAIKVIGFTGALSAELIGLEATARQWHAAGPLPVVPTVMLTATKARKMDGAELVKLNHALQTELAQSHAWIEQRFIDSSHYIQDEKPEAVITAIQQVVARTRQVLPATAN